MDMDGQLLSDERENSHEINEGAAKIIFAEEATTFYNPIQEFNRDLTTTVLRIFSEGREAQKNDQMETENVKSKMNEKREQKSGGIRILDALSASGLRAIRFALEVPNVDLVLANDFSEKAFETIQRNVRLNGVEDRVKPVYSDAIDVMMAHREKRFHAIDLDPYGSASIFLDSAVQAVVDGGILMVTCTDTAILCGNCPEACFNKYGSVPIRHKSCHEMALRILLRSIDSHANRHGRYIVPLLSVSVDFYIRCFVRIQSGAARAKDSVAKLAHVFSCANCQSLDFQPLIRKTVHGTTSVRYTAAHFESNLMRWEEEGKGKKVGQMGGDGRGEWSDTEGGRKGSAKCVHCGGSAIHVGGPLYMDPIHDTEFVQAIIDRLKRTPPESRLGTHARLLGILMVISEELPDRPLFYEHDQLMTSVRCSVPKMASFRSAILNAGFRCSGSHCNPKALKTDAPMEFVWDVCRAWAKKSGMDKLKPDCAGKTILSREPISQVNFALHKDSIPPSKLANILRFQDNKGKNWGPKTKARGSVGSAKGGGVNGTNMR